jgi:hypothetical protein
MPAFNAYGQLGVQVAAGDTVTLFAAGDSLTGPVNSIVIFPLDSGPMQRHVISFTSNFAAAPTAVLEIFGSNTPPTQGAGGAPQNGVLLYTSTNKQADTYVDTSGFKCYWAELVSQSAGGALTVVAHVS